MAGEETSVKYDILEPFKEYLYENISSDNTARKYYAAVVKLFKDIQFNSLSQIDVEWIKQQTAARFRTSSEYSAVKNGLKWLSKYDSSIKIPTEEEFTEVSRRKRNFSRKPKKVIYLKPTQRKINQIQNERLRYAYRLALASGLRVSELADLEAKDVLIEDGNIFVFVKNGKGGHGGIVECRQDPYLYERLPEFLGKYPEGKIFYSEVYMREYAHQLGIEMHDLRRVYAIQTRNDLKKSMPVEQANAITQQRLRHVRFSTTKRYLFNRKLRLEYEKKESQGESDGQKSQENDEVL